MPSCPAPSSCGSMGPSRMVGRVFICTLDAYCLQLHNVEIPSLGQCKFGLSTVTVTGEHENVMKYLVVMPG